MFMLRKNGSRGALDEKYKRKGNPPFFLFLLLTTRGKIPPYLWEWLGRWSFCPVTDTLHMCHSRVPVTSLPQRRWDSEKEQGRGKATLSAGLSPRIEIDIARLSSCLFHANLYCFWGGRCLRPALLSAYRAPLTVTAMCHCCSMKLWFYSCCGPHFVPFQTCRSWASCFLKCNRDECCSFLNK